jgi:ClpP class serine protease
MLTNLRHFLSQPLLLDRGFIEQRLHPILNATGIGSTPVKGMFFDSPCPLMLAEKQCAAAKSAGRTDRKAVAVLPVRGVLEQHGSWFSEMMGGTSVDALSAAFDMCMSEDRIGSVLFDCHTPGGTPFGIKEFGDKVFAARAEKLIVSASNSMMCSAGCWLGAAADRSFVSPMSQNASVGVYSMFVDQSKALEDEGIKVTVCRVPEGKAEGIPYEPLKPEAVDNEMRAIGRIYDEFVASLAKYRKCSVADVKEKFGGGRCMDASGAVSAGLADRVMSMDQVLMAMSAGSVRRQSTGAAAIVEDEGPRMDSRDTEFLRRTIALAELS